MLQTENKNLRGAFSQSEQQDWIHILEFKALYNALESLGDTLQDMCVRLWCDNMTVVTCYNKGFSPKANIRHWLKAINRLLQAKNASLVIQWIPTKQNVPADRLSRANLGDDFQLNPNIFQTIVDCVGGLDIDRFATA